MKTTTHPSESAENLQIITLSGYYNSLPDMSAPKKDFVERVAKRCEVGIRTVHAWIKGRRQPSKPFYREVLADESGIPLKNLWNDEGN